MSVSRGCLPWFTSEWCLRADRPACGCPSGFWHNVMGETILAIGRPAWPFSHMPFGARLETPSWTGPRAEAAASAHELNRWPRGKSEMPRTRNSKHLLKVSLGCARRPGRKPFQTGPAGGTAYTHRYKNSTHRLPFFRGGAFYCVCRAHRNCLRQMRTHFRAARTAAAPAPPVKRTQWKWPPMAKFVALLWLVN